MTAPHPIIEGVVRQGRHLGRELGFPTANLDVPQDLPLDDGVYRSRAEVDGVVFDALSNLGCNPSVGGAERRLETHLLGFSGDLYGRRLRVELVDRIRGERCFASIEALRRQIEADRRLVESLVAPPRPVRLALVGLGVIGEKHLLGIGRSPHAELVGVCDVDPSCASKAPGVPFYADCRAMIAAVRPEWVVVAVPAEHHAATVRAALDAGCDVLCEKPLATDYAACEALLGAASDVACRVMFHWQYGNEAQWFYARCAEWLAGGIRRIRTLSCDPYCDAAGQVRADRRVLCGAWLDGGINVLSFYEPLLAIDRLVPVECRSERDAAGYERRALRRFACDGAEVEIEIDWSRPSDEKRTEVETCDGRTIVIDHTRQRVAVDGRVLFDGATDDRLATHYINFYASFGRHPLTSSEAALRLHGLLLQ